MTFNFNDNLCQENPNLDFCVLKETEKAVMVSYEKNPLGQFHNDISLWIPKSILNVEKVYNVGNSQKRIIIKIECHFVPLFNI